jgi:hypothetical protein
MRALPLLALLMAVPASAQAPPACTAQTEGQAACMAGKLCE